MHSCLIFFLTIMALSSCTFFVYANEDIGNCATNKTTSEFEPNGLFVDKNLKNREYKLESFENYSFYKNENRVSNQFCLFGTKAHHPSSIFKNDRDFTFMDNPWEPSTDFVTKKLNGRQILDTDTSIPDQEFNDSGLIIAYCIIGISVALFLTMLCVCVFIDRDDFEGYNVTESSSDKELIKAKVKSKKN